MSVYKSGTAWEINKNIPAYGGPCASEGSDWGKKDVLVFV